MEAKLLEEKREPLASSLLGYFPEWLGCYFRKALID